MKKNKKRKKIHLNFYKKYIESGKMPEGYFSSIRVFLPCGLCRLAETGLLSKKLLNLFEPHKEEVRWLHWEGHDAAFWGSGGEDEMVGIFTPLRQTIVLFMAAMNNEL